MTDYEKLLLAARYSPTTVGNMILNPKGAYASADAIKLLERQITTLQAELEQCRKDAERYRALRKGILDDIDVCTGFYAVDVGSSGVAAAYDETLYGEKLDAAIDKAMESV